MASNTNVDAPDGNCIGRSKTVENDELPENTAYMSVNKNATHYKMDHPKRGMAFIFNTQKFTIKNCAERHGTDKDGKQLEVALRNLNFDVHMFKDLKVAEVKFQINQAVIMDHSNHDCFLLVVLSHGNQDILYAQDEAYSPREELWGQFTADKCPTLAGKPKLFFLQSCQGGKLDSGIKLIQRKMENMTTEFDGDLTYSIPVQADFLIMYATPKGHFAFRNTVDGSYFITVLCEELEWLAYKEHLLTILTIVIQRVAVEFESKTRDGGTNQKKQTPYFESSLTRLLQFTSKEKAEDTSERTLPVFHSTRDYNSQL